MPQGPVAGAAEWARFSEVQALERIQMNIEGDGNRHGPWGIFGGSPGKPGGLKFVRPEGTVEVLPSKLQGKWADPGAVIRTVSPCGGGFGDPVERDPGAVLDDVLDGIVDLVGAVELYGVVIDPTSMRVELEPTQAPYARRSAPPPPQDGDGVRHLSRAYWRARRRAGHVRSRT